MHASNAFVTLTYRPEDLPPGGTLVPGHMSGFMKRFRARINPATVRFFGVGEYGDDTARPHYHLAMFGVDRCFRTVMEASWEKGFVHVGDLTDQSSAYIASYVLKKMTCWDDQRLDGRHPEFARMSRNPGIGCASSAAVAAALRSRSGEVFLQQSGDVPKVVRIDGKVLPLDTYIRNRVRAELGLPKGTAPSAQIHTPVIDLVSAEAGVERAKALSKIYRRKL